MQSAPPPLLCYRSCMPGLPQNESGEKGGKDREPLHDAGSPQPRQLENGHPSSSRGIRAPMLRSLKEYLSSLMEISRRRLIAAILMMSLTSFTEGLGVVLLFPILQVAGFNLTNQGHVGHYTAEVQQFLRWSGLRPSLWLATLLSCFMLLMALRSLFGRAQAVFTSSTVMSFEMALSRRLYAAVINADWRFLVRRRSSDFTHALTAELTRVSICTSLLISTLSNTILAVVYIAVALKLSAGTTLMVLAAGTALLLASGGWMRAAHASGTALSDSMSEVYSAATEHLQNLKAMKTYGAQATDLEMFSSLESEALEQNLRSVRSQGASSFWFEFGSLLVLGSVIFMSLQILRVGPASMLLLLAVFTRLMPRLAMVNSQLQDFLLELPAFGNVNAIMEDCLRHAEADGSFGPAPELTRELRFENVSFAYEHGRPAVLDRVSLVIPAGNITAINGPSGSGKSTLGDLVNGLLTPDAGRILVDGEELTPQRAHAWRSTVGYVAPDTVLFHDTIRANLLWARPAATEEEMREALQQSAADFVFDLPSGLDTLVGDRGTLLSQGQRQRIALARALLRRPALLILDEATNSLDRENERRIIEAIERLKGNTTVFVITHQAQALAVAQGIYILEAGKIVETGAWESAVQADATPRPFVIADSP